MSKCQCVIEHVKGISIERGERSTCVNKRVFLLPSMYDHEVWRWHVVLFTQLLTVVSTYPGHPVQGE